MGKVKITPTDLDSTWVLHRLQFLPHHALYALLSAGIFMMLLAVYRVTFHPLAKFPGPKLAAVSYLYEMWFDVVLRGRYTREIQRLHQIYGLVIRINPNELHSNDPRLINEIYASGNRKRDKSQHFIAGFPVPFGQSMFGTKSHSLHRLRRSAVNKYFSRSRIVKFEPVVQINAQKLCDKLLGCCGSEPLSGDSVYTCYTADNITEFLMGVSSRFLDQAEWEPNYKVALVALTSVLHILKHFPWLAYVLEWTPLFILKRVANEVSMMMELQYVTIPAQIQQLKENPEPKPGDDEQSVLSDLLISRLPPKEKRVGRLSGEVSTIFAGSQPASTALGIITYYLLANPDTYQKLMAELLPHAPDHKNLPSWTTLEQIPYLSGVVMEGLRLTYGFSQRLERIPTDEDIAYEGVWTPPHASQPTRVQHVLPRGYGIGMSAYIMHSDVSIFPDPFQFVPERWLDLKGQRAKELDTYFLTFSKGSRQCIGMQLAYCVVYIGVAALALRAIPKMKIYKTTDEDILCDYDEGVPRPKRGSQGLQIVMKE